MQILETKGRKTNKIKREEREDFQTLPKDKRNNKVKFNQQKNF